DGRELSRRSEQIAKSADYCVSDAAIRRAAVATHRIIASGESSAGGNQRRAQGFPAFDGALPSVRAIGGAAARIDYLRHECDVERAFSDPHGSALAGGSKGHFRGDAGVLRDCHRAGNRVWRHSRADEETVPRKSL